MRHFQGLASRSVRLFVTPRPVASLLVTLVASPACFCADKSGICCQKKRDPRGHLDVVWNLTTDADFAFFVYQLDRCKLSDTHTKSHKLICPGHGAPQSMAYSFTSVYKLSVYIRGGAPSDQNFCILFIYLITQKK